MSDLLSFIASKLWEGFQAILDGLSFVFQWLGQLIADALDSVLDALLAVWDACWANVADAISWIVDQLPAGWVQVFDWGTGVPQVLGGQSWESYFGSVWGMWGDFGYIFPMGPMLALIAGTFTLLGAIRLVRWLLGGVPFVNL